jgi:hypothetical protein
VIYDNGWYLSDFHREPIAYPRPAIDSYSSLYYLSQMTGITDTDENYAALFINDLTHEPVFMETPAYKPSTNLHNRGNGPFANEDHYHVNMAAFLLLAKWFDFLKENGIYDNTRIIIVSDHGSESLNSPFPNNITLPNGRPVEAYAALLMVKDFDSGLALTADNSFMTNADTPYIAAAGIVPRLINPFTGKELTVDKSCGVTITTSKIWEPERMSKYAYNIKSNEWLHVKDNIFDPANWSPVIIKE